MARRRSDRLIHQVHRLFNLGPVGTTSDVELDRNGVTAERYGVRR
jgi:hypothetical protein